VSCGWGLAVWRCEPWEQPRAFLRARLLTDQVEEDTARGPASSAISRQQPASGFALQRFREQHCGPVVPENA